MPLYLPLLLILLVALAGLPVAHAVPSSSQRDVSSTTATKLTVVQSTPWIQRNGTRSRMYGIAGTPPNHWWLIDYWNSWNYYGSFVAASNTIAGLSIVNNDQVLILPLNLAYGSALNLEWFQFDIDFFGDGYVWWAIWNVDAPSGCSVIIPDSNYHPNAIGLTYTAGHTYHYQGSIVNSNFRFQIWDDSAGTNWFMDFSVPSTNQVYDSSCFSPASAVEGYTTPSSVGNVPYYQFTVGYGMTSFYFGQYGSGVPAGLLTNQGSLGGSPSTWHWEMASTLNNPPVISSLSPDKASPQVVGTTITWTCSASDPEGDPISYRFWLQLGAGSWVVVQDWSSANTWSWTPNVAGTYNVGCWVRDGKHAGSASYDARLIVNGYVVTSGPPNGPPSVTAFSPDKVSPQVVGTTIVWTCSATDPEGDPIVYRFWLQSGSGAWSMLQDWSSSNVWTWTPTAAGTYNVGCWVRDGKHAGSSGYDARMIVNGYVITSTPPNGPPSISGLTPDKVSPQVVGTTITWTCSASDPEGDPILYRFWLQAGSGSWVVVQDWSSANTWSWTPNVAGTYNVGCWVRDGKHAGPTGFDARLIVNGYSILSAPPNSPPTISGLSPDKPSPQVAGTVISWTCSANDVEGDAISYRFWLQAGSGLWFVVQDWSSSATWSWTPTAAGTYSVACWVRDGKHAGSTSFDDRKFVYGYVITSGPPNGPPTVSSLTADKASPQVAGTTIVWTCSASDPEGDSISYRFWLQAGSGAWVIVQDWSSSNSWSWTPSAAGTYNVGCWVRDGKHAGASGFDDRKIIYGYSITSAPPNQPPTVSGLSPDKPSPQVAGSTIVWTCSASDPDGDPISYRFWLQTGPGIPWVIAQDWSSLNTWSWSPTALGTYNVGCWVRDGKHTGPASFDDRMIVYGYVIAVASVLIQSPGSTFLTPASVSRGMDDLTYYERIGVATQSPSRSS